MPGCCIVNCKNRTQLGFRLFRLLSGDAKKLDENCGEHLLEETILHRVLKFVRSISQRLNLSRRELMSGNYYILIYC